MFTDVELSEMEDHAIARAGGGRTSAVAVSATWDFYIQKIDGDRSLPSSDRSVYTEHDLAGALFMRDYVEEALAQLPGELSHRLRQYVGEVDERFRSFTVEDSGSRMATIASVDVAGRGWWWFRVPSSGPIVEDLSRYG